MANIKISDLSGAASVLGTQEFEINDSFASKKVTAAQIATYVRGEVTLGDLGITSTSSELNVLDGITATTAELNYTDGVTSNIQTQLNGKAATTTQTQATWEAGTGTTETIVSPAKIKAAIDALAAAGAAGAGGDRVFWENDQTVTTNYTITNGQNAMSAGPITINSGVTVTVGAGETWTVV
jgi:hypothetical protein